MAMPIVERTAGSGGVNIHAKRYVTAAIGDLGSVLAVKEFVSTPAACQARLDCLAVLGPVRRVGSDATQGWGGLPANRLFRAGADSVVVEPGDDRREETASVETAASRPAPGHRFGCATRVAVAEPEGRVAYLREQIGRLDELVAAHDAGLLASFAVEPDGVLWLLAGADEEAGA